VSGKTALSGQPAFFLYLLLRTEQNAEPIDQARRTTQRALRQHKISILETGGKVKIFWPFSLLSGYKLNNGNCL
jgi:hypothetical protein